MSKPYRVCPKCGAHLDHGEPCDCEDRVEQEVAQSAADTAAQPATGDEREPVLMPVLMPGARYETCRECGLEWNVSKQAAIPWSGYLCPVCRGKIRKEAQARESSPDKNTGSRRRRLRRDPFSPI